MGRCKELLDTYEGKRLHILWSGGIDTTALLVGFLKVATQEQWRDRLSVHYCARSLDEHPRFYERYIKPLPRHELIQGHVLVRALFTLEHADSYVASIRAKRGAAAAVQYGTRHANTVCHRMMRPCASPLFNLQIVNGLPTNCSVRSPVSIAMA